MNFGNRRCAMRTPLLSTYTLRCFAVLPGRTESCMARVPSYNGTYEVNSRYDTYAQGVLVLLIIFESAACSGRKSTTKTCNHLCTVFLFYQTILKF